jgi:hypothetical protein
MWEMATSTFRFPMQTKLPGFDKLVLLIADIDLIVDSKFQGTIQ